MSKEAKDQWQIWIATYGQFQFEGTEKEAEEMRAHKSKFEHGCGLKWKTNDPNLVDKLTELQAWFWDRGGCPQWVLSQKRKAKKASEGVANE